MKRLPALDGLRGIAIGLVLLHHIANWQQGWIGVDLFFVLSGYLITTILLAERTQPQFWRIFYIRRATRILPAFLVFLALSACTGRVPWLELGPYVALTASDFAFLKHADTMTHSGLGNLWSLSVEEHFYLVWPVLVRRCTRRLLAALLLGIIVLEPVARTVAILAGVHWTVTYFTTPFRLDGLAFGSLLALTLQHDRARAFLERWTPYLLPATLLGLAASMPFLKEGVYLVFQNGIAYSLLALTAALVVCFLVRRPHSAGARALAWQPLVFLGRISYGLYLYHVVIFLLMMDYAFAHHVQHSRYVAYASLVVSIAVSWLSFRFLEAPILAWGRRRTRGYLEENAVRSQGPVSA